MLDDAKKFSLSKKTFSYRKDKKTEIQIRQSREFSAGLLKTPQATLQQLQKGEPADKSEKRPERKVGAKEPVKAVTKLSGNNSDINYQIYLSFNLENNPGIFIAWNDIENSGAVLPQTD